MRPAFILFFLFVLINNASVAQEYLVIETTNDPETIKLPLGTKLEYKMVGDDEWLTSTMTQFLYNDNIIVIDEGFLRLEDITHVRRYRKPAAYIGYLLEGFGAGWAVLGTIGPIAEGNYDDIPVNVVAGALFYGLGWGVKKLFYKRTLKVGSRYRLKLMDLRLE